MGDSNPGGGGGGGFWQELGGRGILANSPKKMVIALNAPSPFFSDSPPLAPLEEKRKNRVREFIRRLTKKAYIA